MGVVEPCWFKKNQNRVSRVSLGWSQHTNRVGVGATGICRHVGGHLPHLGLRNIPTGGCFSRCGVPSAPPLTPQAFSEAPGESEEAPRPPRTKLGSPLSRAGLSVLSAPCSEEEASLPRLPRPCLCPASSLGSLLGPPGGRLICSFSSRGYFHRNYQPLQGPKLPSSRSPQRGWHRALLQGKGTETPASGIQSLPNRLSRASALYLHFTLIGGSGVRFQAPARRRGLH